MSIGNFERAVMRNRPDHLFLSSDGNLFDTREPNWFASTRPLRRNFARHTQEINSVADLKSNLRAGEYAWPGAYQLAFIADDGGIICFDCARKNLATIMDSIRHDIRDGWKVTDLVSVDGSEDEMSCDHCNATLHEGEPDLVAIAIARLDAETSDDSFGKWGEEDVERLSRKIADALGLSVSFDEYFNPTFSAKEEGEPDELAIGSRVYHERVGPHVVGTIVEIIPAGRFSTVAFARVQWDSGSRDMSPVEYLIRADSE